MNGIRLLCGGNVQRSPRLREKGHVLLVIDQFPRALGGGERIVLKLAELLPAYGYRVSILTFAVDEGSVVLQNPPCPVYLLPLKRTYDWRALAGALALGRFLRSQRVDLVHTCFESSDLWAGGVTKLLSRARLVWNRRDMGILRGRKHVLAYKCLSFMPDAVFAVSEGVRNQSIAVDGIAAERVITIHNGLDLEQWPERADHGLTEHLTVASLGNIRRVKGHDILIRAFAIVHRQFPEVKLVLGGAVLEPLFMEELRTSISGFGLESSVSFQGDIQNQQKFLQGASIFVLPSRSEGFSNAIIEAMASSLPVIATDVGGNGEAVEDRVTGLMVAPEDFDALSSAVLELLRDPKTARRMGAAGRQRVIERFTTDAMMRGVVSTFDRLLAGSSISKAV